MASQGTQGPYLVQEAKSLIALHALIHPGILPPRGAFRTIISCYLAAVGMHLLS